MRPDPLMFREAEESFSSSLNRDTSMGAVSGRLFLKRWTDTGTVLPGWMAAGAVAMYSVPDLVLGGWTVGRGAGMVAAGVGGGVWVGLVMGMRNGPGLRVGLAAVLWGRELV